MKGAPRLRWIAAAVSGVLVGVTSAQTIVRIPAGSTIVVQQDAEQTAKKIVSEAAPTVLTTKVDSKAGVAATRTSAIKEAWTAIGARAGLAARSAQLHEIAKSKGDKLDAVFNFRPLILEAEANAAYELPPIIPPVIVEAEKAYTFQDGRTVRTADKTYKVIAQARFGLAPTWRTYLLKPYPSETEVERSLQPRNAEEKLIADEVYKSALLMGEAQAEQVFEINMNTLLRDFNGMVQYRLLLANGMISRPFVARSDLGVTGSGDELNLNEAVLRITELPSFVTAPDKWRRDKPYPPPPAPVDGNSSPIPTPVSLPPATLQAAQAPKVPGRQPIFTPEDLSTFKKAGQTAAVGAGK